MISVGQIPEHFSTTDVFELELAELPTALVGRRALYTELIWDAEGGFQQEWIDGSSVEVHEDNTVTFLLKRRAFSASGLSLFTVGSGGGGGDASVVHYTDGGDLVFNPDLGAQVRSIQTVPITVDANESNEGQVLTLVDGELVLAPSQGGTGDGDVVGPAGAVDARLAAFDGTTGKLLKDSGVKVSDFSASFAAVATAITDGDADTLAAANAYTDAHAGGGGGSETTRVAYSGHGNAVILNAATTWTDLHIAASNGWVDDLLLNTSRSGSQITVSEDGLYVVNVNMAWYGSSTFVNLRVQVNGVTKLGNTVYGGTIGSVNPSLFINNVLDLHAGDVVRFQYVNSSSGAAGYAQGSPVDGENERWIAAISLTRAGGAKGEQGEPGSSDGWQTYCDFNFSQMPNQSLNTAGDVTIDGVTMQAGNVGTGVQSAAIVNGTGLVFTATSTTNTFWYGSGHAAAYLGIDLDRLPGFLLDASEVRIYSEYYLTVGTANFATACFGIGKRVNWSGNDFSPMLRQVYASGIGRSVFMPLGSSEESQNISNALNIGMVHFKSAHEGIGWYGKTWAGLDTQANELVFGDDNSFSLLARRVEAVSASVAPKLLPADKPIAMVCGQNGNSVGNSVSVFKRLRIEYRNNVVAAVPDSGQVVTDSNTSYSVKPADDTVYRRMTASTAKTVNVDPNSTTSLPTNGEWHFDNDGAGTITFVPGAGVTIKAPVDGTLSVPQGGVVTLKRLTADVFRLVGATVPA